MEALYNPNPNPTPTPNPNPNPKVEALKTDLNWQDKQGKTPIFYAAEYGHTLDPYSPNSYSNPSPKPTADPDPTPRP